MWLLSLTAALTNMGPTSVLLYYYYYFALTASQVAVLKLPIRKATTEKISWLGPLA